MHIGFAADTYKPYISGVTNYIGLHKTALEQLGHEVVVVTFRGRNAVPAEPGVIYSPGYQIKMGYAFGWRYSGEALAALRRMDIIHLHHPFISGQLILRACAPHIPIIFTGHTRYDQFFSDYMPWFPRRLGNGVLRAYLGRFCRQMDRVVCNSAASEFALRSCGIDVPLTLIPNGIQLGPFLRAERDPALRRKVAGDAEMVYLYTGRLAVEKNLPMLLEAFRQVCTRQSGAQLVLVGTGPITAKLQEETARLGIARQVTFTGLIDYGNLPRYYAAADVFVMPSVHDTHPLAILEALGAGLPIIVGRSPAYADTVLDGENGLQSEDSPGPFAAAMESLLTDRERCRAMGVRSRALSQRFSVEATAGQLVALYQDVLAERARG